MKTKTALLTLILVAVSSAFLWAESDAAISYAEGRGFILVSAGTRNSYDLAVDDVLGLPLRDGDTILTDDATFLEIQLRNGNGGVVKVAENTTFTVMALEDDGGGVFKVTYGRIRVKTAALLGGARIWVTGHDTVAGVRGTDFGYDMFYDRADEGAERQTAVYVFDGLVDVVRYDQQAASKIDLMTAEPFVLSKGKMVVTKSSAPDDKLKATSIDDDIVAYWKGYPIQTVVDSLPADQSPAISEDLKLDEAPTGDKARYETGGKIVFATGVSLMTVGGLVRAFLPNYSDVSLGLMTVGGVATAAGGGMILYSITLP